MSSIGRVFAILGLFSRSHSVWHADDIIASLCHSRASGYRYVKELVTAGFLQKVAAGRYSLGPRIIELDYHLRQSDPVLLAAVPVMEELAKKSRLNVVLSAMFGREHIVDSHHVRVENSLDLAYGRGRLRPLFRGAASKVLVAGLPLTSLKALYAKYADEIVDAGMGKTFPEFRDQIGSIREAGFYFSLGEVERHVAAAAVPVCNGDGEVLAALALVGTAQAIRAAGEMKLGRWLSAAARDIQAAL